MCGVVGQLAWTDSGDSGQPAFERMVAALRNRGPDAQSHFQHGGIRLGHTRLSIIDLDGGQQPMFNETGSIACVFNGEIYNFETLRAELQAAGHRFKTRSDTEVLVHGYEEWGSELFQRLVGMFAIVLADLPAQRLIVARDRFGEKPVYYSFGSGYFVCASEAKSIRLHPRVGAKVDRSAIVDYLRLGYLEATQSAYLGVRKLLPGSYLVVDPGTLQIHSYWKATTPAPNNLSDADLQALVREKISAAVKSQLIADVPLGVFLSGGMDSSTVAAFAAQHVTGRLKTFAVKFEKEIDELPFARMVAERYGTDHTEIVLPNDVRPLLDDVCNYADEPFVDSSLFPTFALSRATRQHVKVVLTGDGGDELFGGYDGYLPMFRYSPYKYIRWAWRTANFVSTNMFGFDAAHRFYTPSSRAGAYASWQQIRTLFPASLIEALMPGVRGERDGGLYEGHVPMNLRDPVSEALRFDLNSYLPDNLLRKVDWASMACSLEARAPFLDRDLGELMLQVPAARKFLGGRAKGLLKAVVRSDVPEAILSRAKQGFGGTVAAWFEGELADNVDELAALQHPIWDWFDRPAVQRAMKSWRRNLRTDWRAPHQLWALFMLDQWARRHL